MMHPNIVSPDKWRDAVKFLMGLGVNPSLTASDQRQLGHYVKHGMTRAEANHVLTHLLGWQKTP